MDISQRARGESLITCSFCVTHEVYMLYPCSTELFDSSFTRRKQELIDSGHPRKTIMSQSDESDVCLSTIRSVSDVFGMI